MPSKLVSSNGPWLEDGHLEDTTRNNSILLLEVIVGLGEQVPGIRHISGVVNQSRSKYLGLGMLVKE
jgi:hypothetical protein